MKPRPTLRLFFAFSGCSLLAISSAHATSANWTGASSDALWSNTANWSASPVPTGSAQTATFNVAAGAGGAVIDLGAGVNIGTIAFASSSVAAYTIGAGAVNSQSLTLSGSGNAGLSGSNTGGSNTNQITINAAITVTNTQQWILSNGANPWIINGSVTSSGAAGSTIQVKINGKSAIFNGVLADQVGGAKLQMSGSNGNTATLTNANNSFTGGLLFDNGNVSVNSISMIGSNSAAGAGGPLLFGGGFGGGSLTYTGTGDTTDRVVTVNHGFNGPTLTQSGASGNLNFTADLGFSASTSSVGSALVSLAGSTNGTGEFSGKLVDNAATGFTPLKTGVSSGVTSLQLHSVDGVTIGSAVTGTGFAPGTTVSAIDTVNRIITLSTGTTGAIAQGANVSVSGLVNITYLTKSGSGNWTLSGANTNSGFTKISGGTLTLANSLALQNSPIDMVGSIAGTASAGIKTTVTTLTLGGLSGTASPKNLSSIFTTTSGGYNTVTALTLNPRAAASFSYSSIIADGATGMTLTKTGAGTQIFGGANSYTGTTTISAGRLIIGSTGTVNNSSGVSIGAGEFNYNSATALSQGISFSGSTGTLSGTGTITPAVTISSGNRQTAGSSVTSANTTASVGKETFTTGITYNQGSIFEWNINADNAVGTGTRGTDYDAVNAGALATTGTNATFRVILNGSQNFSEAFWNTDRTWSNIFTGLDGTTAYDLVSIFNSNVEFYNSGGLVTNANTTGRGFTLTGSSLTWSAVPEPTSALAGLLIGAGLLRRRRA